jgi:hypothetical protein
MASQRQIAANRRNARKSTGPRSQRGKKRASRNAYRHGLAAGVLSCENLAHVVDRLARKILGDTDSQIAFAHARSAAEAALDLARVRHIKVALIECVAALANIGPRPEVDPVEMAWRYLKAMGSPAGRMRAPKRTEPPTTLPPPQPEASTEALRRALPSLMKLDRYERRAVSRRERALREIDNLRM